MLEEFLYSCKVIGATAKRGLLENIRAYPWSFFTFNILRSFLIILLTHLLYHQLFQEKVSANFQKYAYSLDYMSYIVLGMMIYTYAESALLAVGRSLIMERRAGTIEILLLTPCSTGLYLFSVMLRQSVLALIDIAAIVIIALFFQIPILQLNWGGILTILLIGYWGVLGMGVILGIVMLYLRDTYLTQNTVLAVFYLICGVLFPIQYLPQWVQAISEWIPLTQILSLARMASDPQFSLSVHLNEVGILLGTSCFFLLLGFLLVNKVRYLALEKALS